jgi:hypothetical protein
MDEWMDGWMEECVSELRLGSSRKNGRRLVAENAREKERMRRIRPVRFE